MANTYKVLPPKIDNGYSHHHGRTGDEAPNQTFQDGNFIAPDANGLYQEAVAADLLAGKAKVACAPGQNMAVPARRTEFADPNDFGVMEITAGGAAATAALIQVGKTYGLGKDATTGYHYLDLSNTTDKVFRIADNRLRGTSSQLGDTNVRVLAELVNR